MTEKTRTTTQSIQTLFGSAKPIIGMVHLSALPGSPGYGGSIEPVERRALADARALREGGVDGILVENFGDAPFFPDRVPAETIAAMAVLTATLVSKIGLPVGVNVLRNDALSAIAIAASSGARFIRVNVHCGTMATDQGLVHGRAHETLRKRRALGVETAIFADLLVKHAAPLVDRPVEDLAEETTARGLADAVIVTGPATGRPPDLSFLERVKLAIPEATVFVGSGVDPENAAEILRTADGAIVGTSLKRGGDVTSPVDLNRVKKLVRAARS